jgi:hypothetical protein
MSISRAADMYYTFRFLKTLVTDWKDTDAYDEGIIDAKGKNLIKQRDLTTNDQKNAYTTFYRLVFNIKRILEKVPFGRSKLASYAAALFLLREETGMSETSILDVLDQLGYSVDESEDIIKESKFHPGAYMLSITINEDYQIGSIVNIDDTNPIGKFSDTLIYNTREGIPVTFANLG